MKETYKKHYFELFNQLDNAMQARIRAVRDNPDLVDKEVDAFVKLVIESAERESDSKKLDTEAKPVAL
jgi:hypothetical protein